MKIKYFLQLITLFLFILVGTPVLADSLTSDEARNWAQNKGNELLSILTSPESNEKYEKLDNILLSDVDLEHAARFTVGKYWRQMTEVQQVRYVEVFKKYIMTIYRTYPLDISEGNVSFTIDRIISEKKHANIYATVYIKSVEQNVDQSSQGGINVIFVVSKNNNRIQLKDLKIAESSLLMSYRERFYKMIHEDNDDEIDWFITDLEEQVE